MTNGPRLLIGGLLIAYPLLVWWLAQQGLTTWLILVLLALLSLNVVLQGRNHPKSWLSVAIILLVLATVWFTDQLTGVLFYPVWVNAALLLVFLASLWRKPAAITRLALLMEGSLSEKAVAYTEKVTLVWVLFFFVNGGISLATAIHGDLDLWTLYNGFISYVLMGLLFVIEWSVRRVVRDKH
ncbi:hypothetical protein [Idiomarina sp. HP20-50]|uniref:COG4648 family protein n=1 Tax=Idiomarina sp. HP20-50 TaxID=3070813 RepID=UPI00294ADF97|nr:hypothetical protein [Idiomarina sp. HP20-50]MDV6316402.1 hypothetical protein [Idiomarina sp. HP20-50]